MKKLITKWRLQRQLKKDFMESMKRINEMAEEEELKAQELEERIANFILKKEKQVWTSLLIAYHETGFKSTIKTKENDNYAKFSSKYYFIRKTYKKD